MLRLFCLILLIQLSQKSDAQNLVQNPSFENFDTCPQFVGDLQYMLNWDNANLGSADFYNACCPGPCQAGVPLNFLGDQLARTGNGYSGVISFPGPQFTNNAREYISSQLLSPLVLGETYYLSFFISLGDSANYAINRFGAYLSDTVVSQSDNLNINVNPQVEFASGQYLTNDIDWVPVFGSFVANGGEEYITIGNFRNDFDSDSLKVYNGNSFPLAYYYIDDVCLSNDSIDCGFDFISLSESVQNNDIISFDPNQNQIIISTESSESDVFIFDLTGKELYREKFFNQNIEISISNIKTQALIIVLENSSGVLRQKIVKSQ